MKNVAKAILAIAFVVWGCGAAVMAGYYHVEQRVDCVQSEGWFKGLFWCETQPKTQLGSSADHLSKVLKGMQWPFLLFRGDSVYKCSHYLSDLEEIKTNPLKLVYFMPENVESTFQLDNEYYRTMSASTKEYYSPPQAMINLGTFLY